MTLYISDEIIQKVKEDSDIVNIVSEYVNLKKSGSNYVGLCPFHSEKTPSFTVSETKQYYHCFGCGEGGDIVSFIMKKENLEFLDAVKFLADKLGIEIEDKAVNFNDKEDKSEIYEINKVSARYFRDNLYKNSFALEYLRKRNINAKTIRQFGLGFSLNSWDNLYRYLSQKGYSDNAIEKAGLIGKKSGNNGYYDKFRNRIIFPIIDTKSRVIGFGGRVLDDSHPKYLNSQDTIAFNKGNHLYGLNLLNKHSNRKRILLVEGYMDVISLYAKGINYSVASLGTALTDRQCKLIKRYGEEVYICYDSDLAGINAALRAIDLMLKVDVNPRIISLPKGMDPDDYINQKGLIEFEKQLNNSLNYMDFKINIIREKYDLEKLEEKVNFTKEIANLIKGLKSPIEQDVYIDKISDKTGISKEAIEKEIRGKFYKKKELYKKDIIKENIKPIKTILPTAYLKAEMDIIRLSITDKDYYEIIADRLKFRDFESNECRMIYELIGKMYANEENIDEKVLFVKTLEIPNLDKETVNNIFKNTLNYQPSNINRIIDDLINTILVSKLLNKRKELIVKIEELEKIKRNSDEESLLLRLCLELTALNKEINLIN
ncbi:DNA primase [Paratissierella segnis]|jgi:DNA primase|uniref:DNA primase n=1 Tax=Paratissierella segnis TaxID=2763679 RepID=A0A926EVH3_9FIRM|nr:DNA primase [Paratissierella segnis]MBC8588366.1 DNA primase [Paratissierella segnis]